MRRLIFFVLLAALLPALVEAAVVAPFTATYDVHRNGQALGEATLRLNRADGSWHFVSDTRGTRGLAAAAGIRIREQSRFRYLRGRPETLSYHYRMSSHLHRRERGAQVDAAAARIRWQDRDQQGEVAYVAGVIDRQLVTVALMQALARGENGELRFEVMGRRGVEPQRWRIGGREAVATAVGQEQGVRIERLREDPQGRSTLVWLDHDQGHLPLRIEQREDDGELIEMRLRRRG